MSTPIGDTIESQTNVRADSYTTAWKQSLPNLDLDGVEYKSLPSGLHSVQNDLVYFIHENYAGVSAFVQEEADERHRNASFVAVGVLVESHGRLGRAWVHADELLRLATDLVKKPSDTRAMEVFWKKHKLDDDHTRSGKASPSMRRESLAAATSNVSAQHPALLMSSLLDRFGPLLFPLYRASLLRKRVLFMGSPPVKVNCNAVYILSVLASLPTALNEVLQPDAEPLFRTKTLFSVGIHDIPVLSAPSGKSGWIGTTTDDILGEKHQLYDILVDLPPAGDGDSPRRWPKVRTSESKGVKATQRDLRRYRLLRRELKHIQLARKRYRDSIENGHENDDDDDEHEASPLMRSASALKQDAQVEEMQDGESEVVEPMGWTAMAYDSFMWWASAGEQEGLGQEEESADRRLLGDLPDISRAMPTSSEDDLGEGDIFEPQETATVLTAYFHRLTSLIIQTLAGIVAEADDETEEGIEEDVIQVSADDVKRMGLDSWSEADKEFVREAMKLYFEREAVVADGSVRMCGMKIC